MKPRSKSAHLGALIDGIASLSPAQRECLRFFKNLYVRHGGAPLFPAIGTIAQALGVSERTVQRHVRWMQGHGILVPLAREHGGLGPTVYEFRVAALASLAPPTPAKMSPPHPCQNVTRVFNKGRAPKPPTQGKPSEEQAMNPMDGEGWEKSSPLVHATSGSVH